MFKFLGRLATRHPWRVLVVWLVVFVAGALATFYGFGQGNLFSRMETTEYIAKGTDSAKVTELVSSDGDATETAVLVVSNVDIDDPAVEQFALDHRDLLTGEYIESVTDAFSVRQLREEAEAEAQEQIQATIQEQIEAATEEARAQATEEAEAAKAQIQQQADQAAALGPEAMAAAQAEADAAKEQVDAQTEEAITQAQETIAAEVTQAVQEQAEEAANTPEAIAQREEAEKAESALLGEPGDSYAVVVELQTSDDKDITKAANKELDEGAGKYAAALTKAFPNAQVNEMSQDAMAKVITGQVERDLISGEALGLPIAAILMLVVFGGATAAGLPLVGAASAIVAGMGVLWVSTWVTDMDTFILNVVSIIGLSLSIDYGLLVVSRFREEGENAMALVEGTRAAYGPASINNKVVVPAVDKTVQAAGRTVVFSAVTIALALSGIFFINVQILHLIAWGGIIITLLAVLAAVTIIPALLTLIGRHLLKPSPLARVPGLGRLMAAVGDSSQDKGVFSRIARAVQKRPWTVMFASLVVLVIMAIPLKGLNLRNNFEDYIPPESGPGIAFNMVKNDYPELSTPAVEAVVDAPEDSVTTQDYVNEVALLEHVESVSTEPLGSDSDMTLVKVHVDVDDSVGPEVTQVVEEMRDLDVEADSWVGGAAANQHDFSQVIARDSVWALVAVGLAVLILLFLMTGSVIVPIKALIINSLSILAALGATTAVFQYGWFGVPKTAGLETFIVVIMIAFGFGLAMDYEVFLLARIKEYWDAGESNNRSVATGLQRSGRIITSAAAIIIAVFIGFGLGENVAIKQIGVGLAIMVATDATITRMLLVPATMTIMGKWNWWAPKPLAKFAKKFSLTH